MKKGQYKYSEEIIDLIYEYYYGGFTAADIFRKMKDFHHIKIARRTIYNYLKQND